MTQCMGFAKVNQMLYMSACATGENGSTDVLFQPAIPVKNVVDTTGVQQIGTVICIFS